MIHIYLTPEEREEALREMAERFPEYREQLRMEFNDEN